MYNVGVEKKKHHCGSIKLWRLQQCTHPCLGLSMQFDVSQVINVQIATYVCMCMWDTHT